MQALLNHDCVTRKDWHVPQARTAAAPVVKQHGIACVQQKTYMLPKIPAC